MTAPVDVLAVWDEAKRFARFQSTSYETPYHLFTAMDEARAAVAELIEASEAMRQAVDDETAALEAARHNEGVDAAKVAESRVTDCSVRLSAALARCKGGVA